MSSAGNASGGKSSMDCLRVQRQIRENAQEMQDYLSDLRKWEKTITRKDEEVRSKKVQHKPVPVRPSCGSVGVRSSAVSTQAAPAAARPPSSQAKKKVARRPGSSSSSAAAHTYDQGYSRWEKFDVDAALADDDDDDDAGSSAGEEEEEAVGQKQQQGDGAAAVPLVTPATITADASRFQVERSKVVRPRPRAQTDADMETAERERGNEHYRRGDFGQAVRCYTRCIGINSRSAVSFSNRAMAYLKLREFGKADHDATLALQLDPTHVKSLQRRASARSSRGMFRAALLDLQAALALQPASRELLTELRRAKEAFRAAVRRSPRTRVPLQLVATAPLPPPPLPPAGQPPPQEEEGRPLDAAPDAVQCEARAEAARPAAAAGAQEVQQQEKMDKEALGQPLAPTTGPASPPPPPQQPGRRVEASEPGPAPPASPADQEKATASPCPAALPCHQGGDKQPLPGVKAAAPPSSSTRPSKARRNPALASSSSSSSSSAAPKTLHDLQRAWRALGGSSSSSSSSSSGAAAARARYLREVVKPAGLSRVLQGGRASMEPELLGDAIATLAQEATTGHDEKGEGLLLLPWLEAVAQAGPMALMLLDAKAQAALQQLADRCHPPPSPALLEKLRLQASS